MIRFSTEEIELFIWIRRDDPLTHRTVHETHAWVQIISFYFEYLAREKYSGTNFSFVGGCVASFLINAGITLEPQCGLDWKLAKLTEPFDMHTLYDCTVIQANSSSQGLKTPCHARSP